MMDAEIPYVESVEEQVRRLEKINRALMGRVERSMDFSGGAFSLFQTAILLEDKVKARTRDLEKTVENLSEAFSLLEDARDDAEMAKQNLTAAIEAVSEGFALFDVEERLVMCNEPFRALMNDIQNKLMPGVAFQDMAELFASSASLVIASHASRSDWSALRLQLFRKPHASFIQQFSGDKWLQISNKKMASGATVIFQTDITDTVRSERVRHERELDEQSRLLQATIDNLPQGICMFSQSMRMRAWNRRLIELLSLPVKAVKANVSLEKLLELARASAFALDGSSAIELQNWLSGMRRNNLSGIEFRKLDGTVLDMSSNAMPDGGLVLTFQDVTQERQAASVLKEVNETLEQRVEERTAALRREVNERRAIEVQLMQAKELAEAANKGKTQFLAAASHDLLQPLNASRIFLSLLQETELDARQVRFIDNADKAFASVEELLESLLDISRFESHSVETNVSAFAVDDILQTLVAEYQPVCERKNIELRYVRSSKWVTSDRALLRRIVQNLMSNAIRYTVEGKVLLAVRTRGTKVSIDVFDTGGGIPESKRKVIFEEFRRLHPVKSTDAKAMGLGLAIVDRIAKLLGHRVIVESRLGKGSRFAIEVDLAEKGKKPASIPDIESPKLTRRQSVQTVFVVENDLQILEGMVELLESRQYHVIPVVSTEEALEALETLTNTPSLIIADFHLDNGTGVDAIKALRKACGKFIPAIMITADHSSSLHFTLQQHKISFLGKPLKPGKLFEVLAELEQ
jgi:two-component system, sensor histidine kinase